MITASILLMLRLGLAAAPGGSVPLAGGGSLEWQAPARGCPPAATVAALVDQHLAPRGDAAAGVRVSARVEGRAGKWAIALRIETREGTSTRTLAAGDCHAAAETVALAVALAVGPAVEQPTEVPPAPEPEEPPPTIDERTSEEPTSDEPTPDGPTANEPTANEPTPDVPTTNEPAPPSEEPALTDAIEPRNPTTTPSTLADREPSSARRLAFDLVLGGGLTFGHVARLGAATQAQVALVARRVQVSLRADHLVRRRVLLPDRSDAGGLLSFTTAALEAGPVLRPGPLELPLLAAVSVGAVRGRGFGSDFDRVRTVPWAAVGVGPGVRWAPLPRLVLGLRAELSVALVRHSFTFGPSRPLATTGLVAGHAWATIGLRLP